MSHTFGIQVTFKAVKGKGDDLVRILSEAAAIIENLPGCQSFIVLQGMADPDRVMVTKIWDSQQSHQASLANREVLGTDVANENVSVNSENVTIQARIAWFGHSNRAMSNAVCGIFSLNLLGWIVFSSPLRYSFAHVDLPHITNDALMA
ncbi:antibiotic biosynthesis monooxygenase family protein [Marinicella meishanensis]|uniref:antibiotic biosynthesis monooxygenase family protein n=1 Tax=Marinicella meishanensis TaxID=2873263 RepID=UPI001CBC2E9D|nr:antibiotic biosynthesis monooxygenase family protein [Marinicella sp. NBU2979]